MAEEKRFYSWNVNGLRAVAKKGFLEWMKEVAPFAIGLQETKAWKAQLPKELVEVPGYHAYFAEADKKGYSGVALYLREEPREVERGFGIERFDNEGRILIAHYDAFTFITIYYPNGKKNEDRLRYKMDFYDAFLEYVEDLRRTQPNIIICGDVNTAHKEKDLARPKANETVSGFLPEERAWIDAFLAKGYIDTFRMFTEEGDHYTWWNYIGGARKRNVGWRIDYFYVTEELRGNVLAAGIESDVMGSDHCPVSLTLGDL